MKYLLLLLFAFITQQTAYAQEAEPMEITPQILKKITSDVEKEAVLLKDNLTKNMLSETAIEYALDTFRIEQITLKRTNMSGSLDAMVATYSLRSDSWDKLLNKYYNKLKNILIAEDKKLLVSAQKSWLSFRNAEINRVCKSDCVNGSGHL